MVDELRYLADRGKPKSDAWKHGPKLTMEDLKNGRGVERITEKELRGGKTNMPEQSRIKPRDGFTFAFGKYRGRLVVDVLEENPGYVMWAKREVQGFAEKLEAAGIDVEEEDDL